tara:strand:- start:293 stop:742 length:450 start_codon:yes stop_codon:yes gene_type:complete
MPTIAINLQKHVMEHVQIESKEKAAITYLQQVQQTGGKPADDNQMLEIERLTAQMIAEGLQALKQMSAELAGGGAGPDPLIALKEKELEIKAKSDEADYQIDQSKLELDAQNQATRADQFGKRLSSQEEQTQARIQAAMQREILKQSDN